MSKVKIMRDLVALEIEIEDMKRGDVFALYDGSLHTCSDEPIYDDDEECFYIQCGIELYSEALLADIPDMKKELIHGSSLDNQIQKAKEQLKETTIIGEKKQTIEKISER